MVAPYDRRGERHGYLTAVRPTQRVLSSGRRMPAWELVCDCGNTVVAMTVNLAKGKHRSCGCKRGDLACETAGYERDSKKPVYRVYRQMIDRCYLTTAPNYRYYGLLGVSVCDRWRYGENGRTGFQCFIADMGERPEGLTLDRINPYGDYEPANCRWATWATQHSNRRAQYAMRRAA